MKYLFRKLLSDKQVEDAYVQSGANFGDAVSYSYMGEPYGIKTLLNIWARWEREYSRRGYKTISLDDFIVMGGYDLTDLKDKRGIKRRENEKPVLHAELYRQHYLAKVKPEVNIEKMLKDGKPQGGTYIPPSTKIFAEDN
jgi:hypothetical protein